MKTRLFRSLLTKFPIVPILSSLSPLPLAQPFLASIWHPKITMAFPDANLQFHPSILPSLFLLKSLCLHPSFPTTLHQLCPPQRLILRHKFKFINLHFIQHELSVLDLSLPSISSESNLLFRFQSHPYSFISLVSFIWFSFSPLVVLTFASLLAFILPTLRSYLPASFMVVYTFVMLWFAWQAPTRFLFHWQPKLFLTHLRSFVVQLVVHLNFNHVEQWDELCHLEWVSKQELRINELPSTNET